MSANKLSPRALNLIEVRDRFIRRHGPGSPYLKHLQREIDEAMQPQEDEPQHFVVGFRSSPPSPPSPPAKQDPSQARKAEGDRIAALEREEEIQRGLAVAERIAAFLRAPTAPYLLDGKVLACASGTVYAIVRWRIWDDRIQLAAAVAADRLYGRGFRVIRVEVRQPGPGHLPAFAGQLAVSSGWLRDWWSRGARLVAYDSGVDPNVVREAFQKWALSNGMAPIPGPYEKPWGSPEDGLDALATPSDSSNPKSPGSAEPCHPGRS